MGYRVQVEHFEGPLDLLLQLVEKNELEISTVSLASVTGQFVEYVNTQSVPPEELADFLVVASRLIYMKSKLLLPDLEEDAEDDGPDLAAQLRQYQRFVSAAREIDARWKAGQRAYSRPIVPIRRVEAGFRPPPNGDTTELHQLMKSVVARLEPLLKLPQTAVRRVISLQERIQDLLKRVQHQAKLSFERILKSATSREDAVVSFLALLELIKQRFVRVEQGGLFEEIAIQSHPEAPSDMEEKQDADLTGDPVTKALVS